MIGRAAIGYPWIFREIKHYLQTQTVLPSPTLDERIDVCKTHLKKSVEWKGPLTGIFEMRRHYTNYLKGLPGIKDFRMKLVTLSTPEAINEVLDEISVHYKNYEFERTPIEIINYHEKCPL
jgi:tRNA-dihydrouridine synthase